MPGPGRGLGRGLGDREMTVLRAAPWCRWGAGPACVVAGRSCVPDVAGAWGSRPSMGSWVWGRTVSEGQAVVVSVGGAACASVGGSSGGAYVGLGWF